MVKTIIIICLIAFQGSALMAQRAAKDEANNYQHERMVFIQWDKNKFTPTSGWLGVNPLYWLTWGLHTSYKKTDKRPLSAWGPQTQRLGLTAGFDDQAEKLRLESDTVAQVAQADIARTSGLISGAEPLWILYYSKELKFVLNATPYDILNTIPTKIRAEVLKGTMFNWYTEELGILRQRIEGAKSADMDRGARILAYHRMLLDYRVLNEQWMNHLSSLDLGIKQEKNKILAKEEAQWTPGVGKSDKEIAKEVVSKNKGLGSQ